jgi:asparagine synthase (glutamine-hydrolysing)
MGFANSRIDERPYARLVSGYIGSEHVEILIQPKELTDDLKRSIWFVDDLFGDWGVITTMILYRKAREAGVKVVLVGEGSDELFGGYPNFVSAGGVESDNLSFHRRALRLYRWYSGRRWGKELWRFTQNLRELYREADEDSFATVRLFETRNQLPNCYNMKVDKASMAASVEARVPFLDVRVANEGFRTPRSLLLRNGTNKYLLRRMAEKHQLLPPEIVQREKFGASMATSWMDELSGFRQFARDIVLDSSGWTKPLGLRRAMEDYFDRGRTGYRFPNPVSIFSIVAWRLLLLNLWSRQYLQPGHVPS